jgi:long-chain-acyl-CoA dehydrogenase
MMLRSLSLRSLARQCARQTAVTAMEAPRRTFAARTEPAQAATLMDIGTRSIFTEEHDMFREMVRKFYAERVVPFHDKWEEVCNPI